MLKVSNFHLLVFYNILRNSRIELRMLICAVAAFKCLLQILLVDDHALLSLSNTVKSFYVN